MLKVTNYSCGDLFCIEPVIDSSVSLMNMAITKKRRFENDRGFGLYFFKFDDELLYAGSYCGSSGVARDRWWTHLASITCRFQETNFTNLSAKNDPKLGDLLARCDKKEIDRLLEHYKNRFRKIYSPIMDNQNFFHDVGFSILSITSNDNKKRLQHLLGDGRCSTFENRVQVANDRWEIFKELEATDIANRFSFQYVRITEASDQDALSQFLYSQDAERSAKRRLVQRFIEDKVIEALNPPANKIKTAVSGEGYSKAVIDASFKFIGECIALGATSGRG